MHARHPVPDGFPFRCLKEEKWAPSGWPPPIEDPIHYSCSDYVASGVHHPKWEWDHKKSQLNKKKHGISFNEAVEALELDPRKLRIPARPDKWEKLEGLDYEGMRIPRTQANLDPVRDWHLFNARGLVWLLVSTLRGEMGLLRQRVISVHRASAAEIALYQRGL